MISFFKFVIGTVIGSFISLVSIRIYRNESVIFPPSHCDYCGHRLKPWELIPIISFIILRGRCSRCHHKISSTLFVTELIGGLITLINPTTFSGTLNSGIELLLLMLSLCDVKKFSLPLPPIILLATLAIGNVIWNRHFNWIIMLVTVSAYLLTTVINRHQQLIGSGDIDIIFTIIVILNWKDAAITVLIASILALIYYGYRHPAKFIPFVPFLSLSYFIISEIKRIVITN